MTHTTIGAMIIKDMILKHNKLTSWEKLYDPSRKMTDDVISFIEANMHVGAQYRDWVTPSDIKDIEDMKPGTGCVVRDGLKKSAVYRDNQGKFHHSSAVCPHMFGKDETNNRIE